VKRDSGVVEGISECPLHKDCHLGRHSYRVLCSLSTVGISSHGRPMRTRIKLRASGPGETIRALVWPAFLRRDNTSRLEPATDTAT